MKILSNTIIIILFLLGTFFFFRSCHAGEWITPPQYYIATIDSKERFKKRSVDDLKQEWIKELEMHKSNALRCYEDAKERCWWLPNLTDREKARHCYTSVFAALGASTPNMKLVLALGSLLMQYGLDCMDEWEYIENKLNWAKFHFEMVEHYQKLLEEKK